MSPTILAIVLAGGEGSRLRPLTREHAKPALPFANGLRIIDFVLSNLINSGISSIHVLAQYKPASLVAHIDKAWNTASGRHHDCAIDVIVPPARDLGYLGTAHAVHCILPLIERVAPDLVAVFAADHVYRMDVRQMVNFHLEHRADVSVAAIPVPVAMASSFGIIEADHNGRIRNFQEKPSQTVPLPAAHDLALASMGNYLFDTRFLVDSLRASNCEIESDFARHFLPRAARVARTFAYDFSTNRVPGLRSYEEPAYWRDVGTLPALREARLETSGPHPIFDLTNASWPIRGATSDDSREVPVAQHADWRAGVPAHGTPDRI